MTYEIIATLGPASSSTELWREMIVAGASEFRLNSSHLSIPQVIEWVERMRAFFAHRGKAVPVVIDLQGSKWRLGNFPTIELVEGMDVILKMDVSTTVPNVFPVTHADFFTAAPKSSREIRLNDAKVVLEMAEIDGNSIRARVVQGGPIAANKGITYAESEFRSEGLSEKDLAVMQTTLQYPFVRYAISYVKNAVEMISFRKQIGAPTYLIAKLERGTAIQEARAISAEADEVWLCRGDLGAELGLVGMAQAVHQFSSMVPTIPIPVMLAGQVLEHMTEHPSPTRSEITCLHDALLKEYQGFVLSDETAIGRFPVQSCKTAALFRDISTR
ncbi:MAG TPA: pyruvate kinase [Longilinea sp.]|nr:pyruvate kinase [Longilinea sp.]